MASCAFCDSLGCALSLVARRARCVCHDTLATHLPLGLSLRPHLRRSLQVCNAGLLQDALLVSLIQRLGTKNWSVIARGIPGRTGKSCRLRYIRRLTPFLRPFHAANVASRCLSHTHSHPPEKTTFITFASTSRRWYNQLSPELKRGPFEAEEDRTIILAHAEFGNQWSRMAKLLPGRTDNAIKNRWHSALKRTVSEGLPAGTGDPSPTRAAQQQPSHLGATYFGQAQRQASADSPAWRNSDAAGSDRQVRHTARR